MENLYAACGEEDRAADERERAEKLGPNAPIDPLVLIEELGPEALMDSVIPTRCEHGCEVEPDGVCPHGAQSVMLLAGLI